MKTVATGFDKFMSSSALVDDAIHDRRSFKEIGTELRALPPDPKAAQQLISAYRAGQCAPWLTAFLLGCVGDPVGYETAREILLSNAGMSSESYAGVAMARMVGLSAYDDLREILFGDHPRKVRDGAAHGMQETESSRRLDDFFDAFVAARLTRNSAAWHIAACSPADKWLCNVLRCEDQGIQKLGCAVLELMVMENSACAEPGPAIAPYLRGCLSSLHLRRLRRERLSQWLERLA